MFNKIQAKRSFGHHVGGAHNSSFLMLRVIHKLKTELKWNSDFFSNLWPRWQLRITVFYRGNRPNCGFRIGILLSSGTAMYM